jgi:hypothetical protein
MPGAGNIKKKQPLDFTGRFVVSLDLSLDHQQERL